MPTLLDAMRDHLIAAGIVRDPDVDGAEPPMWRHPDAGAVAPTAAAPLVASAFYTGGISPAAGAEDRRQLTVDVQLRTSAGVPGLLALERAMTLELVGTDPGGRTDWVMGGLYVIQSRVWTELAPIDALEPTSSWRVGYLFEVRA
jgi:hypothetical protein